MEPLRSILGMKATRKFPIFLLLAGVALIAFYQWGLNTHSGREAFPEMAGTIPFLAGVAGATCVMVSGLVWAVARWRRRKGRPADQEE